MVRRRVGDRPPLLGHRSVPRTSKDTGAHTCAREPLKGSTRHTASSTRRAMGVQPQGLGLRRRLRREERAGGESSSRRLGAPAVVLVKRSIDGGSSGIVSPAALAEWESRWWSPISTPSISPCANVPASSTFGVHDLRHRRTRRPAVGAVRCARQMNVPSDGVPRHRVLSQNGGFKSDLTIMRLGDERFRVVTGGASGLSDSKWFRDHLPDDGTAELSA